MIVSKTFDEMLEEIEFKRWIRYDFLVPEDSPEIFNKVRVGRGLTFSIPNHRYITEITGIMRIRSSTVYELFYNAFGRGNLGQSDLPVSVKIFDGEKGKILRIRDSGEGFDLDDIMTKIQNNERYFRNAGGGFNLFTNDKSYNIAYEGDNNIVNLQVMLNKPSS